ncbi:zinc-ribbon domain-containing protein [Rhodococcus koreensis]|uniref:Probable Zinc-ribbon domain-containing protein n=2 Tax=Rhodococcus koreensis TaxID=99653 RepID=A0A1H4IJ93_9NOCA|nr:zinc-ribbon domain-containing protein [Rhodococcus koreensis]SEB33332.1 Probable Zinc-ribbon domain-containing protein [Rhodococcus koreensis]
MRLQDEHPELFRQLHPTRNVGVDLDAISNSSHEMLWWRCPVGHEWRETPLQRRSPARWKKGDLYACLYCIAPGAVVHSCGHRRLQPSETTFRVLAHPCERCEVTEHTHLILDAHDESAAAAVRLLDTSPLYALFCSTAADTVEWWDELFPLVEAYFVRMVSVYVAIAAVEHRPTLSSPTSSLLGACMLRILDALPPGCREEMQAAVPDDAGHFRDRYLPGHHKSEIGWALKKLGFDILDTPLGGDIERRVQFCEHQRFTATGELPPVDLADTTVSENPRT